MSPSCLLKHPKFVRNRAQSNRFPQQLKVPTTEWTYYVWIFHKALWLWNSSLSFRKIVQWSTVTGLQLSTNGDRTIDTTSVPQSKTSPPKSTAYNLSSITNISWVVLWSRASTSVRSSVGLKSLLRTTSRGLKTGLKRKKYWADWAKNYSFLWYPTVPRIRCVFSMFRKKKPIQHCPNPGLSEKNARTQSGIDCGMYNVYPVA